MRVVRSPSMRPRVGAALAFTAITLILVPVAYALMFSTFNAYDDEGSHLLSLRGYVSGHSLFTQLVTYHGPFFYEVMGGLFKLTGIDITNDSGRLVTLFVWLLATLAGGLAVYRLTRSLWLGLSAQLMTFHVLGALVNEPMQPAGVLSLLMVGLTIAAAYRSRRPRATAALIGGLVAAAFLVKINVGVFAILAVAFAFAGSLSGQWRRVLLPATCLILALAPLALMAGLLSRDWVIEFALVVTFAAAALGVVVIAAGPQQLPPPAARLMLVGGSAVAVAIIGTAVLGGTRLPDLVNSLVVVAYRQPLLYVWPLRINVLTVVWAAACLVLAVAVVGLRTSRSVSRAVPAVSPAVTAVARIAVGGLTWICVLLLPSALFMLALPLVWVVVLAPRDDIDSPTDRYARLLLPALAVMESLQAYPVAGTQLSMAALALVPVGAITFGDGIRQLRAWAAGRDRPRSAMIATVMAPAALILNLAAFQLFAFLAISGYESGRPLALPGAESIRLPPEQGAALRSLSAAIGQDCTSFITMPGMPSLYIWTRSNPPALLYDSTWIFVLDAAQQQSIVDEIRGRPGLCVVKNQAVLDFWAEGRPIPNGPLVEYIDSNFTPVGTFGDYELMTSGQ